MDAPSHFKGKDAVGHVAEAQAQGIIHATEVHGTEMPGHLSAGADACRETALLLSFLWLILAHIELNANQILFYLTIFSLGWVLWKTGRSAWLGWFRLERLHRVLEQERWEIEHHHQQERDELRVLYQAKGFEGKLLEDVLDVLMADNDRLLKVMVEEELGLSLEAYEHPLKQGLGAGIGTLSAALLCLGAYKFFPQYGLPIASATAIGLASTLSARHFQNRTIPAIVWNLGIAALGFGSIYFFIHYSP